MSYNALEQLKYKAIQSKIGINYDEAIDMFIRMITPIFEKNMDKIHDCLKDFSGYTDIKSFFNESISYIKDRKIIIPATFMSKHTVSSVTGDRHNFIICNLQDIPDLLMFFEEKNSVQKANIIINFSAVPAMPSQRPVMRLIDPNFYDKYKNLEGYDDRFIFYILSKNKTISENSEFYLNFLPDHSEYPNTTIRLKRSVDYELFKTCLDRGYSVHWEKQDSFTINYSCFYVSLCTSDEEFRKHCLAALVFSKLSYSISSKNYNIGLLDFPFINIKSDYNNIDFKNITNDLIGIDTALSLRLFTARNDNIFSFSNDYDIARLMSNNYPEEGNAIEYEIEVKNDLEFYKHNLAEYFINKKPFSVKMYEAYSDNYMYLTTGNYHDQLEGYFNINRRLLVQGHKYGDQINYISVPIEYECSIPFLYEKRFSYNRCYKSKNFFRVDTKYYRQYYSYVKEKFEK